MERLALHIESLIFSSEHTISLNQIKTCVEETLDQKYKNVEIKKALDVLIEKYNSEDFSFEIVEIASGFKFLTKGSYHNTVSTLIKKNNQKRLSKAALETLAIIAYKQPVTKSDVEGIRGVNADYTIQKLLEKELVAIAGRTDGPGRPLIYTTSEKFMDYFGIKDVGSLPKLKDLKVPEIQIGEPAPIEEDYADSEEVKDNQDATPVEEGQAVDSDTGDTVDQDTEATNEDADSLNPEAIVDNQATDTNYEIEEVVGESADQSENGIVITEAVPEPIDRVLVKDEERRTNMKLSNEEE